MQKAIRVFALFLCTPLLSFAVLLAQAPQAPNAPAPGGGGGRGGGGRGGGAPAAPAAPVDPHDLNGYWLLPPDPRDGREIPTATLVPGASQKMAEMVAKDREALRYCNPLGMPTMMGLGTPYNIRISRDMMVIVTEYSAAQNRWIYLNRGHIPSEAYDPSAYGDSVGKWEGNTLVVDTTMFHPEWGSMVIPGGGFRTPESRLVERFTLLKNGQVLQVTSTWTDPKVFAKPHTYEYRYNRMVGYETRTGSGCDPYDAERVQFLSRQRATP